MNSPFCFSFSERRLKSHSRGSLQDLSFPGLLCLLLVTPNQSSESPPFFFSSLLLLSLLPSRLSSLPLPLFPFFPSSLTMYQKLTTQMKARY